jgi:nucleoside-diphosphate-sugar epimerase
MKALVTGGAGFIGAHPVEALVAAGEEENRTVAVGSEQLATGYWLLDRCRPTRRRRRGR